MANSRAQKAGLPVAPKIVPVTEAQIGDCVELIDLLSIGGRFYGKLENGRQPVCRVREMVFEVTQDSEADLYKRLE